MDLFLFNFVSYLDINNNNNCNNIIMIVVIIINVINVGLMITVTLNGNMLQWCFTQLNSVICE